LVYKKISSEIANSAGKIIEMSFFKGLAMVPGKHIVSIEIDVLGHNNLRDEITQMTFDDDKEDLPSNEVS
jgi:hypothetical protein